MHLQTDSLIFTSNHVTLIVVCFRIGLKTCRLCVELRRYLTLFAALRLATVTLNARFILLTLTLRFCSLFCLLVTFVKS